ncbi:MAG TPA: threonine synthase [Longimicrobiales bacterium]|nr:threonine synthase [Longimicrobiales bacterium]
MTTATAPPIASPGVAFLECGQCGAAYGDAEQPWGTSPCCARPLLARYELGPLRGRFTPAAVAARAPTMWRYAEVLPVRDPAFRLTLGEGMTPLLEAERLAHALGLERLWLKDEGQNPTGSFKARGLAAAVARARELGLDAIALPSAGNAGSAAAAYAAAAGLAAHVAVPRDTPRPILEEMRALGADVELVDGHIGDAAKAIARGIEDHGWFDVSTLKEPYRVEGKKTMAYELVEQLGRVPEAIVYPTGGGTGLVGMWKAFDEMEELGWIGGERPRMISVQGTGCAPIVRAWEQGRETADPWDDPQTYASGLRVPRAIGDFLVLEAIRASGGAAVAVTDPEMREAVDAIGRLTGVFAAPEGGATAAAVRRLLDRGMLRPDEEVVLFITGSGLKYI